MRDELSGDRVVLTRWLEDCIAIWSAEGWAEMEARLRALGSSSPGARRFVRWVASSAHIDEVDRQGRITVPQRLRDKAALKRDVVVIGALNHGEIWSPERWEQHNEVTDEQQLAELAEGLDF
jgi:MraZ protein